MIILFYHKKIYTFDSYLYIIIRRYDPPETPTNAHLASMPFCVDRNSVNPLATERSSRRKTPQY